MTLIFQTKWRVTGSDNAYMAISRLDKISDIKPGKKFEANFGGTWTLNFKEVMDSYGKQDGSGKPYKHGKYTGNGILEDTSKCDWTFTSNILKGTFRIIAEKYRFRTIHVFEKIG